MKKIKVTFAPGAFNSFEGTQEELDSLVQEITQALSSMNLEELSAKGELEELIETPSEISDQYLTKRILH